MIAVLTLSGLALSASIGYTILSRWQESNRQARAQRWANRS